MTIPDELTSKRFTGLTDGSVACQQIAAGERFDVILCDLMMPKMTGAQIYARLLGSCPEQAARMVFLSGGAFGGPAQRFVESMPNRVFDKPFGADQMKALVASLVAKNDAGKS